MYGYIISTARDFAGKILFNNQVNEIATYLGSKQVTLPRMYLGMTPVIVAHLAYMEGYPLSAVDFEDAPVLYGSFIIFGCTAKVKMRGLTPDEIRLIDNLVEIRSVVRENVGPTLCYILRGLSKTPIPPEIDDE